MTDAELDALIEEIAPKPRELNSGSEHQRMLVCNSVKNKLRSLFKDARVVYCRLPVGNNETGPYDSFHSTENPNWPSTHTALLFNIREIKKDPCKHENNRYKLNHTVVAGELIYVPKEVDCEHCGIPLKAEWRAVE